MFVSLSCKDKSQITVAPCGFVIKNHLSYAQIYEFCSKQMWKIVVLFFWKREALLILDNYIKVIQLYKIHPGLCITKIHTAYEKETKKRTP